MMTLLANYGQNYQMSKIQKDQQEVKDLEILPKM
jgi:hypothetical protein